MPSHALVLGALQPTLKFSVRSARHELARLLTGRA